MRNVVCDSVFEVRLYAMIGNTVGSMRRVPTCVPGGSCGTICAVAALTWSVADAMSVPQSKLTEISAEPRLVVERTPLTPGTLRIACSIGRVTITSICSAGRSPASSDTTTRGKSTVGNSDEGRLKVTTVPTRAATASRNSSDRRCCSAQALNVIARLP